MHSHAVIVPVLLFRIYGRRAIAAKIKKAVAISISTINQTVAIIINAIADFRGRPDGQRRCCRHNWARAAIMAIGVAIVVNTRTRIFDLAIAVVIDAVARFRGARMDRGVAVVTVGASLR